MPNCRTNYGEMIKNFARFFILCAWIIGTIGGAICAGVTSNWLIMICSLASIWMGWDKAKEYVKKMME